MEKTITYNCEWCNKEHTQTIGNYNRSKVHFCSISCASKYRWIENNKIKEKLLNEEIECGCGCGETLKKWVLIQKNGGLRERKFIVGHSSNIPNKGQFKKEQPSWNAGLTIDIDERLDYKRPTKFKKGIVFSEEDRIKMSCGARGISIEEFDGFIIDNNPRLNRKERELHSKWRDDVFKRDNYTCQLCGDKCEKGNKIILNAHHIKHWKEYPELRRELSNGTTLCLSCHNYVHSKKYKNELEMEEI